MTFAEAVRSGGLRVDGPRDLVRAFPSWLLRSHFADVERPARPEPLRRIPAGSPHTG